MRYLRAIFNFGIMRGYIVENPISRLDFADCPRKEVTIPAHQVAKMLNHALENDLALLPFLTLGFFCGIRPDGELRELEWSDVKLPEGEVVIRPEISKTNRRRFVELSDNAKAWLGAYVERGGATAGKLIRYSDSQMEAPAGELTRRGSPSGSSKVCGTRSAQTGCQSTKTSTNSP